jgi:hypothetical protein
LELVLAMAEEREMAKVKASKLSCGCLGAVCLD